MCKELGTNGKEHMKNDDKKVGRKKTGQRMMARDTYHPREREKKEIL